MLSDRCDFNEFVHRAQGKDYQETIYLADREATEAERRFYHQNTPDKEKAICGQDYARCLKEFITYMRYGIKPPHIRGNVAALFDQVRKNLQPRSRPLRTRH
jgi:hypothetical protein